MLYVYRNVHSRFIYNIETWELKILNKQGVKLVTVS